MALLLQLALPFVTVHQATAQANRDAPFVICTGVGLLWISPNGARADGATPADERVAGLHCPVCFTKPFATAALLPVAPPFGGAEHAAAVAIGEPRTTSWLAASAPPLPPRGPPFVG